MYKEIRTKIGKEELIIATGKLAKQASGSVTVQYGGTMVLVTCVSSRKAKEEMGFFPLTVEYQEKTFASGKIPGGFFKREGKPTEKEVLTARLIDRPIRPLFPDGMLNEVQVMATVLSSDGKNDSDVVALVGASAALTISDIPFNGPIGAVRVAIVDEKFVVNPTFEELEKSRINLIVVGTKEKVVMLEAGSTSIDENMVIEAIKFGHKELKALIDTQNEFQKKAGKKKRTDISFIETDEAFCEKIAKRAAPEIKNILEIAEKQQRIEQADILRNKLNEEVNPDKDKKIDAMIQIAVEKVEKDLMREIIFKNKRRLDGRKFTEVRPISCEINILPRTHGSGLFTRGETQSLAVITLGTGSDEQRIETLQGEGVKTFMLHYNFPPFSVGETKPVRGPGRREIGHGALAEKALKAVMPVKEKFPYTVRIVSEILESNGSSSMATVCAGSLALMGSGVPISDAVSGIAMGLVTDGNKYEILTDIAGAEDHYGDMDFKVAGTRNGITAVQMDVKIDGIDFEILAKAFEQAKKARLEILDIMEKTIAKPMADLSPEAPRIIYLMIATDKIKDVIGPGGKMIRKIIAETGVDINIEDDGSCQVASADKESLDKAVAWIKSITAEPEIGMVYNGKIIKIMNFGAFCEFLPGREGLIHVSEISNDYVKDVSSVLKEGQEVKVKLLQIDEQNRCKLSMKQVEENKDKNQEKE